MKEIHCWWMALRVWQLLTLLKLLFRYGKVGIRRKKLKDLVEEDAKEPALTKDGQPFQLYANADTPEEVKAALDSACHGVGLFRTEALFLRKMKCLQRKFSSLIIVNLWKRLIHLV